MRSLSLSLSLSLSPISRGEFSLGLVQVVLVARRRKCEKAQVSRSLVAGSPGDDARAHCAKLNFCNLQTKIVVLLRYDEEIESFHTVDISECLKVFCGGGGLLFVRRFGPSFSFSVLPWEGDV